MTGKWSITSRSARALCLTAALFAAACDTEEPSNNNQQNNPMGCPDVMICTPAAATCDGQTAVTSVAALNEETCTCEQTETRTDCAANGQVCSGGACMNTNPGEEICDNTTDDDADGMADCMDTDCAAFPACQEVDRCMNVMCNTAPAPACDGTSVVTFMAAGVCDPTDGMCDYAEAMRTDCATTGQTCMMGACAAVAAEICDDMMDNDGDNKTDCMDEDCAAAVNCQAPMVEICDDNMDNDGDNLTDCADTDCVAAPACQPATPACLIISQYMEGSSNNKALELYNCGGAGTPDVDLSGYLLCQTNRGSSGAQGNTLTTALAGSLAAGAVTVYCNAGEAVLPMGVCDGANRITGQVLGFNGNDTVYIVRDANSDGACDAGDPVLDAFGHLSGDASMSPSWADRTYDRCDLTPFDGAGAGFDPIMPVRYTGAPADTTTGFGAAPSQGGCPPLMPEVCDDMIDNDLDGQLDCADMDCAMDVACLPPDPCMGVTCDMPPAPICDGSSAVTYVMAGTCSNGTCSYAEAMRTDCGAMMMLCDMGACVAPPAEICNDNVDNDLDNALDCADSDCMGNPACMVNLCMGVTCDMPPMNSCDGDVAVTHMATGMCNPATGMCLYPETRTNCAATTQVCSMGACVAPPPEVCTGGLDEDRDGAIDCADSDCAMNAACMAAAPCLIVSEYVEGTSAANRAVEVFNCGATALNLDGYSLCVQSNANNTCSRIGFTAGTMLAAGAAHAVCNNGMAMSAVCAQRSGSISFNGNDRIFIYREVDGTTGFGATDVVVDSFGQLNNGDPGLIWENKAFRRCNFTAYNGQGMFSEAVYYTQAADPDDLTNLGTAPVAGCP